MGCSTVLRRYDVCLLRRQCLISYKNDLLKLQYGFLAFIASLLGSLKRIDLYPKQICLAQTPFECFHCS